MDGAPVFRTPICLMITRTILLLLLVVHASCNSVDPSQMDVPPPLTDPVKPALVSDDQLRNGDKIEVFVMEDTGFNGIYLIREKGDIILPKVGRLKVSGMTISSAEQRIKSALEGDQLTTATVIADRVERAKGGGQAEPVQSRIMVYLSGQVNRPGQHRIPVPSGRTIGVWEALMIGGGIKNLGDERKVYISRQTGGGQRIQIPVNLRKVRMGDERDVQIGNGDIVVVPQAKFLPL